MMTSLQAVSGSFLYYLTGTVSLLLVVANAAVLIQTIRSRRDKRLIFAAVWNMLFCFAVFVILMDFAMTRFISPDDALKYKPYQRTLFSLPWILYAGAEVLSAVVLCLLLYSNHKYRKHHLTSDAIRQTLDLLPEGICISDGEGTVLLSNLKMDEICRELTGGLLSDAGAFIKSVKTFGEEQNGQYIVALPRGGVRLFAKRTLTADGREYDQLTASDVTERYRIIEELKAKNERLQDLQRRMKAVSALSGDMFVAQEEAAARAALHDQLGQVLLMGRHFLDHPENTDAHMVYLATKQMNSFLLGEYEEPVPGAENLLAQSVAMAKSIGVTADLEGDLPDAESLRNILAYAVQECAANTVKHASGDRLTVKITQDASGTAFVITNNGAPPKAAIVESGGLLSLRHSVEAAGGTMTVQNAPAFSLTLRFSE